MTQTTATRALPLAARLATVLRLDGQVWARRRTRLALGRLDAHLLKDIGLDPMTAQEEAGKPFWQD